LSFQYGTITGYHTLHKSGTVQSTEGDEVSFRLSDFHPVEQRLVRPEQPVAYQTEDNVCVRSIKIVSPETIRSIQTGQTIVGHCRHWNKGASYGFIAPNDSDGSVFVHIRSVKPRKPLTKDQAVSFRVAESNNSLNAVEVTPLEVMSVANEQKSSEEVLTTA